MGDGGTNLFGIESMNSSSDALKCRDVSVYNKNDASSSPVLHLRLTQDFSNIFSRNIGFESFTLSLK